LIPFGSGVNPHQYRIWTQYNMQIFLLIEPFPARGNQKDYLPQPGKMRRLGQWFRHGLLLPPTGQYHERMGFSETIFLFFLALLIFGPKKLPEIARQVGKVLNDLRRASNEFKAQIESEVSNLEREQQQRALPASEKPKNTVAAMPAAAGHSSSGEPEQSAMARVPDA
jgi:Sec-independent protein translocase protein TatA